MIVKVIQIVLISLYLCKCYIYLVNIFQQNHYDQSKYLKSLKKYYLYKHYQYYYYVGIIFVILSFLIVELSYITLILLLVSFNFKNQYIIKLKVTKRIIRLTMTTIICIFLTLLLIYRINHLFYFLPLILPFIIILVSYINSPLERLINNIYIKKAKKKIQTLDIKNKIAITGSFGKTSCKNMLVNILSKDYVVDGTPKSYNTILGISKTINNDLKYHYDVYVMEMGAFRRKEINKMSLFYHPNIVLITEIGPQHMSTFKIIENIVEAKFEIINGLTEEGYIVLNYDNEYIRNYSLDHLNQYHIYTYGIDYGMWQARNIIINKDNMQFDIYKGDNKIINIKTYLLGRHQILNILASYVVIKALSCNPLKSNNIYISDEEFKNYVAELRSIPHRLEYRKIDNLHIFDDSYSSNIVGFKNACEVLSFQEGRKIIITPGIVDGGSYEQKLNEEIASTICNTFDNIYLINNVASKYIQNILKEKKIKYHVFSSFKEAYSNVLSKYNIKEQTINLLIENDLPDSFLER